MIIGTGEEAFEEGETMAGALGRAGRVGRFVDEGEEPRVREEREGEREGELELRASSLEMVERRAAGKANCLPDSTASGL